MNPCCKIPQKMFVLCALIAATTLAQGTLVHAKDSKDAGDKKDNPLELHMKQLGSNHKKLRRQARRKHFTQKALSQVIAMQTHALAAMHEMFDLAEDAPAAQQPKIILGYRKTMAKLLKTLLDLEIALLENKQTQAVKLVAQLSKIHKDGHEHFRKEEDDDKGKHHK